MHMQHSAVCKHIVRYICNRDMQLRVEERNRHTQQFGSIKMPLWAHR